MRALPIRSGSKPAVIYLVRHGHSTANLKGILAGRDRSIHLSQRGLSEVALLAKRLETVKFAGIYSSPLPRCIETLSSVLETRSNLEIELVDDLIEMDYGKWSSKKLSTLSKKSLWPTIQKNPSQVRFPDGESFAEMNARSTSAVLRLAKPGKNILICSHGDVIKAILTNLLGSLLDNLQRIGIDPASISMISLGTRPIIHSMNDTSHLQASKNLDSRATLGGGSGGLKT